MEEILSTIQSTWTLLFAAAILRAIGEVVKKVAPPAEQGLAWKIFWQTFPLHPILAGVVFGLLKVAPVPDWVSSMGGKAGALYYGGAGFLSIYYHDVMTTWKKYKSTDAS